MALIVALLFNGFWNGIVFTALLMLFGVVPNEDAFDGWTWWGAFAIHIPFEVVGVVLLVGLARVLLEPFRRTTWRFERNRIVSTTAWPVHRREQAWEVRELDRLEIRRNRMRDLGRRGRDACDEKTRFELAFVDADNVDLCDIRGLAEDDVRWMGQVILERRPNWFGR